MNKPGQSLGFIHNNLKASYLYTMDISFKELQKRDVINLPDGKCLGKVTDLVLDFPRAVMTGVCVPGKKQNVLARIFSRTEIFIDRSKIVKIGNDVILVDVRCKDVYSDSVGVDKKPCNKHSKKNPPSCEEFFDGYDGDPVPRDESDY